jgi:hypothetical protein
MSAAEIVNKVWNYAHVLRDDGVGYGDYVEQITYLIYRNGKTYAFDRMWGNRTIEAMDLLVRNFADKGISFRQAAAS